MVDAERVERLLTRVADDLREVARFRTHGPALLDDPTALAAIKYYFITAIEGCARIAHHIIASECWTVPETNADALRRLGIEGVLDRSTADSAASAVGFRNVLVHQYADVDDRRVLENLDRLADLEALVTGVARWLQGRD